MVPLARLVQLRYPSPLGYKMRKHISKAIARRSGAIRTALDNYNNLAREQNPPRPTLEYADVAAYGWLGEFELLKHSRHDVMSKPWSISANREVASKYFKIICAHEEIKRLNVEIHRLGAWVDHEDHQLSSTANSLVSTKPHIAEEVRRLYAERHHVNNVNRARLGAIYKLEGFSGSRDLPGHSQGVEVVSADARDLADLNGREDMLADEDDDLGDEAVRLGECMERMTL